ncbi:MAG: hypothetical protein MPW15_03110 [Candidatus Manganitrophus sp.]|nr:hypothetical protein [Candidatus Manganitrophus sp.]
MDDPIGAVWEGVDLLLEGEEPGAAYLNVLTGERIEAEEKNGKTVLPFHSIFKTFPLGLLINQTKA